jgi:hypothetical protein
MYAGAMLDKQAAAFHVFPDTASPPSQVYKWRVLRDMTSAFKTASFKIQTTKHAGKKSQKNVQSCFFLFRYILQNRHEVLGGVGPRRFYSPRPVMLSVHRHGPMASYRIY